MKRLLSNLNLFAAVILALIVVQLLNFIALRNPIRADWSQQKYYKLSSKTEELLHLLDRPVKVFVLFKKTNTLYPEIEHLLQEYTYASRNIEVEWIDPDRDISRTEKLSRKYGLSKSQVLIFEMDGKSKVVEEADIADYKLLEGGRESVLSAFRGEQVFSSAIQGLWQGKTPVVYFLVGHGEGRVTDFDQISGYSKLASIIFRDNIEPKELVLTKDKAIPEDAAALVVPGPTKRLDPAEIGMIDDYLNKGGRILFLLDALKETGLEPMLRRWGVVLRRDFVLDPENTLKGSDVSVRVYYEHPITSRLVNSGFVRFFLPRSVEPLEKQSQNDLNEDRPTVSPLLITSKKSWSETQVDQSTAKFDPDTADRKGPITLAVAVERGATKNMLDVQIRPTRMVIFGDADFVSNGALSGADQDMFMSALNWLIGREKLMSIAPKPLEEVRLVLTERELSRYFLFDVLLIPLFAVVWGVLIWFRRRK
jgi:ABC-type uncharacterized transport system involved in gliding motility auxiliary subunit